MKLDDLRPADGAKSRARRVGRGMSSGLGKTSGRGMKGQNSRTGGGVRPGFEGGQMPLYRRLPKIGFNNHNKKIYTEVNLDLLEKFEGTEVTAQSLKEAKLIKKINDGVVILGTGNLTKKLNVKVARVTKTAKEKIEAVGGKVEVIYCD